MMHITIWAWIGALSGLAVGVGIAELLVPRLRGRFRHAGRWGFYVRDTDTVALWVVVLCAALGWAIGLAIR